MKSIGAETRCCVFCGKGLSGRSDKKFCDDTCRNNFAHLKNRYADDVVRKVNKTLQYNRDVLKSIVKCGRKIVKKQLLADNDFNFDIVTGIYKTQKKYEYKLLYDYAYRYINEEEVLVLKYS